MRERESEKERDKTLRGRKKEIKTDRQKEKKREEKEWRRKEEMEEEEEEKEEGRRSLFLRRRLASPALPSLIGSAACARSWRKERKVRR